MLHKYKTKFILWLLSGPTTHPSGAEPDHLLPLWMVYNWLCLGLQVTFFYPSSISPFLNPTISWSHHFLIPPFLDLILSWSHLFLISPCLNLNPIGSRPFWISRRSFWIWPFLDLTHSRPDPFSISPFLNPSLLNLTYFWFRPVLILTIIDITYSWSHPLLISSFLDLIPYWSHPLLISPFPPYCAGSTGQIQQLRALLNIATLSFISLPSGWSPLPTSS